MNRTYAEILLAGVIISRSTAFLFSKIGLASMNPLNLLAVRFGFAFIVLVLLFRKKLLQATRKEVGDGCILGIIFTAVMAAEMYALKITDISTTSFLENTAIMMVPLMEACALRQLPKGRTLFSCALALAGVGFLTLRGGMGFGYGEALCMVAAVLYALSIVLTGRYARQGDPLLVGIFQVGTMGALSLLAAAIFEAPRLPATLTEWSVILLLSLVCTCFGFTLQPVAQRYIPSERAAQFCAINPLSVAVMGAIFMGDSLGLYGMLGGILIVGAIVLQNAK